MSIVEVYPSNWLIKSGITGFHRIFREKELDLYDIREDCLLIYFDGIKEIFFETYFKRASELNIPLQSFYNNSRVSNNKFRKKGNKDEVDIDKTNKYFFEYIKEDENLICSFCNKRKAIKRKETIDNSKTHKHNYSIVQLDERHFTPLACSLNEFANLYWEGKPSNFLCLPCELIIYCTAFGFTKVGNRYVFVNAPASLREIIEINNIWAEYSKNEGNTTFKESVIEILKRMERAKAKWTLQNISFIELAPYSENTFNIHNFNIPVEIANAVRKMIQSYPSNLRDIYDIFLDYIYGSKPLYDVVGNILYGYFNREQLYNYDKNKLLKSSLGRLILSGRKLKNPKDLLFFVKFQREVDEYGQ